MTRYQGGKKRIAKELCHFIQTKVLDAPEYKNHTYFEPMVGMCGIMQHIKHPKRYACDIHPDVIAMWQQFQQDKWQPPTSSSKSEFEYWKSCPQPHPNRAIFGFGCSFGAHFFAGYNGKDPRQPNGKDPALIAFNNLQKVKPLIKDVVFLDARSYDQHETPKQCIIYVDPPYYNTRSYSGIPHFNHQHFWNVMNLWAKPEYNNVILISELCISSLEGVSDNPTTIWYEVWSKTQTRSTAHPEKGILQNQRKYTVEKLFCNKAIN